MSEWARRKIGECALIRQCGKAKACLWKLEEWERNGRPSRWVSWHQGVRTDCDAGLIHRLINYERHRIEVRYADGTKTRFWVARSDGPLPIHIEIKTRTSTNGPAVYLPDDATFTVIYGPEHFYKQGRLS